MAPASPRRFRFGRSSVEALPGETILAALGRRGWPSLTRSIRYHRPRGPICGVGNCTGCLVRVNGVPNVRACQREAAAGDRVRTENAWPGPQLDLLGLLDRLLPRGVDTVHGLRRPAWATTIYQRFGRRLAGFGHAPDRSATAVPAPARAVMADVVVVGAGRTGRAVAAALAREGRRVTVVDRRPGGDGPAPPGSELLRETTGAILSAPSVAGGEGFALVGAGNDGRGVLVRAPAAVVATGAYDAGLLFEGSDRPGVVTADLVLSPMGLPLGESVVVGGGSRAEQVLDRLAGDVRAVVTFGEVAPEVVRKAADQGVLLYPRSRLVRTLGRGHVRAVELARRDGSGTFRLDCRSVVLAHRRLPNAQLAFQAGATRRWFDAPGAYYPEVDGHGRTAVPGLFVVGSAAAPHGVGIPTPESVAAGVLGRTTGTPPPPPPAGPAGEIVPYYRELLRERRRGKWVLCACEDVLLPELEHAVARGYRGMELGMRYTGVGTGLCQGRYCLPEATVVLALLEGRPPSEVGFVTQRPPLVPTALGTLAGLADALASEGGP